jgi:hypothetical protein
LNFSRKMVHIPKWKFLSVTPAIFADGAPDPPVTSFVALSPSVGRSMRSTHMTWPWRVMPPSTVGSSLWRQRWIEHWRDLWQGGAWTRVLNEKWGRRRRVEGFKGGEPLFSSEFYRSIIWTLISQWVKCNRKRPCRKRPRGRRGGQEGWPTGHTLSPKIIGFFQNSLINPSIHSYPWIWKFGKKI